MATLKRILISTFFISLQFFLLTVGNCSALNLENAKKTAIDFIVKGSGYCSTLERISDVKQKQAMQVFCKNFLDKKRIFIMRGELVGKEYKFVEFWVYENGKTQILDEAKYKELLSKVSASDPTVKSAFFVFLSQDGKDYMETRGFTYDFSYADIFEISTTSAGETSLKFVNNIYTVDPRQQKNQE